MTSPDAIDLFGGKRREWSPVYAFIERQIRQAISINLASPCDDMCGVISCLG